MNNYEHEQADRRDQDLEDRDEGVSIIRAPEHYGPGEYIAAATLCNPPTCIALVSDS